MKLSNWEHEAAIPKHQAIDFMRKTIRENPYEISLLAVGQLTNIALLFLVDPEIPKLIKELHIGAGVFSEEVEAAYAGEMPMANWNAWADPHACAVVYHADAPVHRTYGLNVTTKLVLPKDEKEDLFRGSKLMEAVGDFGSPWLAKNDMTFHDPLAGACLFKPDLCGYQRGVIDVELKIESRLGMMDFKASDSGGFEIATDVDRDQFFEYYFSIVCG